MICPYCSEDIEPIELNGKTFCSNCGLGINNSSLSSASEVQKPAENIPIQEAVTPTPTPITIPDEVKVESTEPPIVENTFEQEDQATLETTTQEGPILMDILSTPAETTPATPKPEPVNFDSAVQNIENLGTAGILLDILSNEQSQKANEVNKKALEAAEELIDNINIQEDSTSEKITGAESFIPKDGRKLQVNILDDSIVNPLTHPELVAAEPELDLPLPQADSLEDNKQDLEEPASSENGSLTPDEPPLPVENLPEPGTPAEETIESEEITGENEYYEKSEVKAKETVVINHKENLIKELMGIETTPSTNIKSQHLKDYFSQIIKTEEPPKKTKKKAKKKKKSKKEKKNLLIPITTLLFATLVLVFLGYYYFKSANLLPTTITPSSTQNMNETFETKEPKEIPYGYQKNEASFDQESLTYTVNYQFINDNNRALIFKQIKTDDTETELKKQINQITGSFEVKNIEDVAYTVFGNGTMLWQNENFVYIIEVKGDTFKDMVEKMASSLE